MVAGEEYPIQVVARRTGLTVDTLRAWERRYHAVAPRRSANGRRVYSDGDIERLLLLRAATDGGRRIGRVASLELSALRRLVEEDREQTAAAPPPRRQSRAGERASGTHLADCLQAIEAFDGDALTRWLSAARVELALPALISQLIVPLLEEIGLRWQKGELRVAHEHLASAAVRSLLEEILASHNADDGAPLAVATTPAGERHELGALLAALIAASAGWRTAFLGADLPAEEIAGAALGAGARVVLLSVIGPADSARAAQEVMRLGRLLPENCEILLGGRGAGAVIRVLGEQRHRFAGRLEDLPGLLEQVRAGCV